MSETNLPRAVARLSSVPRTLGTDVETVTSALQEAVACLSEMWKWQTGVAELLPDGLTERVRRVLRDSGVDPEA